MKRFITLTGLVAVIFGGFLGFVRVKMRTERPDVILDQLRRGKGNKEELRMRLNLARGDTVPGLIAAAGERTASAQFRADMLDLLFRKYRRSGDERILPVLREALGSSEISLRRAAVAGFDLYGSDEHRLYLLKCVEDPDLVIRRRVLLFLTARSHGGYNPSGPADRRWEKIPTGKREALVTTCVRRAKTEDDPDLRYLARAVVGREIEFLCHQAYQTIATAEFEKGEELIRRALALDPENHQARVRLVRHFLAGGKKKEALALAQEHGVVLRVPLLRSPPKIDGDPMDKEWGQAFRYTGKPFWHGTARWAPRVVTGTSEFYIGHHDNTVYVAVLGYEHDLRKLIVKHRNRDSDCWRDDCVEIFFDPTNSESEVYQFVINPVGALFDSHKKRKSTNVVCQWAANVFHDRGYWSCELAVPAKNLGNQTITPDSVWGINIMRTRIGPAAEQCAWWPTFGGSQRFHLHPIAAFDVPRGS